LDVLSLCKPLQKNSSPSGSGSLGDSRWGRKSQIRGTEHEPRFATRQLALDHKLNTNEPPLDFTINVRNDIYLALGICRWVAIIVGLPDPESSPAKCTGHPHFKRIALFV
jgi:hypothetical protein